MSMQDRMKRTPVTEQEPKLRAKNFEEVCLGSRKSYKRSQ